MTKEKSIRPQSSKQEIGSFLDKIKNTSLQKSEGYGRLLFAIDATASREKVWDQAMNVQNEMFLEASGVGKLEVKLAYYRGFMECFSLPWSRNGIDLMQKMSSIRCAAGTTQIARILKLALIEQQQQPINGVVFVGDAMEENCDKLANLAGRLGLLGVPIFVFQDGYDQTAEKTFREIARLSKGVWCRFDGNSAKQLRDLLCGVAIFASGGRAALKAFSKNRSEIVKLLTQQL